MSASVHNRTLARARKRSLELEPHLAALVQPVLARAGEEAARNFSARVTDFLTAAAFRHEALVRSKAAHREAEFVADLERAMAEPIAEPVAPVERLEFRVPPEGLAAAAPASTSTMIAVYPRPAEATALAQPGGEEPGILHITLVYVGDTDEATLAVLLEAMRPVAARFAPLAGAVGGVGSFGGEAHPDGSLRGPSIVLPDVFGLSELRVAVAEALVGAGLDYSREHGFCPHITLSYTEGGLEAPPVDTIGQPLHFDELVVTRGDVPVGLPFTGAMVAAAGPAYDGDDPVLLAVAAVAEEHMPEGGYGDTAFNTETGAVRWVPADWTEYPDEYEAAEAAFLAVDGVESFEPLDSESCLCSDPDESWVLVYGGDCCSEGGLGMTAAGEPPLPPQWASPAPDELLDVEALVKSLRGKTDPVRLAVVENMMRAALEGVGLAFDAENPYAKRVLSQSASQIVAIARTTQENVMRIIDASYREGLTIRDTAGAIRVGMEEASGSRAETIARTELAGAVNGGSVAAVEIFSSETGIAYQKEWLTGEGAQYPRHEEYDGLDGQTVGLEDYFDVGGAAVMYPGDPDGPPEEIINCRCTVAYVEGEGAPVSEGEVPEADIEG